MKTSTLSVAIALASAGLAGDAAAQGTRTFGSWTAVCDNVRRCSAYAGAEPGGWGYLLLSRDAGSAAEPTLAMGGDVAEDDAPSTGPLQLWVDGRQAASAARADAADADNPPQGTLEGRATRDAIAALRVGRTAEVRAGVQITPISLTGSAAALLWIDEQQGRVRNVTALASTGPAPAAAVPRAPAAPRVRGIGVSGRTPPTAMPAALDRLAEVRECLAENGDVVAARENLTVVPLPAGGWLWGVPCGQGAYNLTTRWWSTDARGRGPRAFAWPTSDGRDNELINASYSREEGSVHAFARGRGLGDCGVVQSWVLTATGPALIEELVMGDCVGVPPELWPRTYVAEVVEG